MFWRILLLFQFLLGHRALGESVVFYVGTKTDNSTSQGIYRGTIDLETGKLGPLTLAVAAKNPNFLALSPGGRFLYAALADSVGAYRVEPGGALQALNEQPAQGAGPCHVSLDRTGRVLFVANYGAGSISTFLVNPDGRLGARTALIPFTGSGPNANRQKQSHAHSVFVDPENKFGYACDLGSDSVWIFKFDAATGALVPANPPAAKTPPGSGPRHLAFSKDDRFVYVVNEMGLSVTAFARDPESGALTLLETDSTLPPDVPTKGVTTAEIACHPCGKWLYVSNRGCDTISVFGIATNGRLSLLQNAPSVAKFPRGFAIAPTGRWLVSAGQSDNRIAVLKIDPATGQLTPTDQAAAVGAPICVVFAPGK